MMYTRQGMDGRFPPSAMRPPLNYSGNAFREEKAPEESIAEEIPTDSSPKDEPKEAAAAVARTGAFSTPGFHLDLGRFFRTGGIGFEEILLLGLILLLSQSDTRDDLLLLLVVLLLIQ